MALAHSPRIVTDGLVLCLDAGNTKGYDKYENLLNYSEQFDNAAWGKISTSVSANATAAPDGTLTADNVTNTPNSGSYLAQVKSGLSTTTTYTASVYVKPLTTNKVVALEWGGAFSIFNLSTLTTSGSATGKITTLDNGWYRISSTATNVTSFNVIYIGAYGNTADTVTVALWGAQLEISSTVSDYYATTGTAKTRGSTLIDLSSSGKNGTLTNGPTYNSSNGGSIVFDGTNDYALITQTLSTPITISGFIRYTDQAKTLNTFINSNPHTVIGISLNRLGGGQLYVYIGNGSGWLAAPSIISSSNMLVNTWYQVTFTSNGSGSTLYLNGNSVGTSIYSPSGWGSTYYLGALNFGGEYLKGNIATTQIYNRALTSEEIQQNFNSLRGRFGI